MENKIFLLIFFGIFLFSSLISAESIGTFAQNAEVELYQTCNNCTYCNITSIKTPDSYTIISNVPMIKTGTYFNYSLSSGNISSLGTYKYCYYCGNTAESSTGCIDFDISYNGTKIGTNNSIFYVFSLLVLFIFFFLALYVRHELPESNSFDEEQKLLKISYLKYLRPVLLMTSWMIIVSICYIISNIGFAYMPDTLIATFFFNLFKFFMSMTIIFVIIWFMWILNTILEDKKIRSLWEKGVYNEL